MAAVCKFSSINASVTASLSTQSPSVSAALHALCTQHGFSNAALYSLKGCPRSSFLATYPDKWVRRYFEAGFHKIDPVAREAKTSILPVDWTLVRANTRQEKQYFKEAEDHGISRSGATVTVRDSTGAAHLFSVTSRDGIPAWTRRFADIQADLVLVAMKLTAARLTGLEDRRQEHRALTKRELEVLEWAGRDKSAWETGKMLGISQRTVECHVRTACEKLSVISKTQAVASALHRGLISPN